MFIKILLILLTIASFQPLNLKANAHDLRDEINNLKESVYSGNSTADMIDTIIYHIDNLDKKMLIIIEKIKTETDNEAAKLLDEEQKAWQEYARSRSAYYADKMRGGSGQSFQFGIAYIEEAVKRIHELEEMYWEKVYGN